MLARFHADEDHCVGGSVVGEANMGGKQVFEGIRERTTVMMTNSKGDKNRDACSMRHLRSCLASEKEVACEEQQQLILMTETKNGTVIMKMEGHSASTMTVNSGTRE